MNRKILLITICSILLITSCTSNSNIKKPSNNNESNPITETFQTKESDEKVSYIKVTINDTTYTLNLENNKTAEEFISLLPQEFDMSELNGNEKYVYIDKSLPTNSTNPKHIEKGDIMLFGDNCLVIFYKSFDTNYSYTKIGHIDSLDNLGNGNITVKFEKLLK